MESTEPGSDELITIHRIAADHYARNLRAAWWPRSYLQSRGIGSGTYDAWSIGYAEQGRTHLIDHLRRRGTSEKTLLHSGLALPGRDGTLIDRFRNRVMFPIRNPNAEVVGFIGRTLSDTPDTAKYLNSPETLIYHKGSLLYGLTEQRDALAAGAHPVLVEGPMDVLAISKTALGSVRFAAVSPCGTAITADHLNALRHSIRATSPIVVAFDADTAGQTATRRTLELLSDYDGPTRALTWPQGTDPADYYRDKSGPALQHYLENAQRPLLEVVIDHHIGQRPDQLDYLEGRMAAARAIAPLIIGARGENTALAAAYVADKTQLQLETVTAILIEAVENQARSGPHARNRGDPDQPSQNALSPASLARQGFQNPLI